MNNPGGLEFLDASGQVLQAHAIADAFHLPGLHVRARLLGCPFRLILHWEGCVADPHVSVSSDSLAPLLRGAVAGRCLATHESMPMDHVQVQTSALSELTCADVKCI